jgi:hypothetical protein
MRWQGVDAPTRFHAGGKYDQDWVDGSYWVGKWRQEGDTLHVEEWRQDDLKWRIKWKVKLATPRSGDEGGREWWLAPLPGGGA